MTRFYSSLLLSTTLVTACASTDVGNPISTEIEFAGYQGAGPQPDALVLDNGLTVEEAFIKVRSFQLDRSEACDDVDNSFDGVVLVDLLEQTQSDAPFWVDEAGTFCRLRLKFTTDAVESQPTQLTDAALWVRGTTLNGESFELQLTAESTLSLSGPFTLPEGSHLLQVAFYLDEWFAGIDESALVNGLSDSDSLTFESNVLTSARLFHDANQDGELDTTEIATSLAYGE